MLSREGRVTCHRKPQVTCGKVEVGNTRLPGDQDQPFECSETENSGTAAEKAGSERNSSVAGAAGLLK